MGGDEFYEAEAILGGAQLRSNHPVNFLPGEPGDWPYGYRSAHGCRVRTDRTAEFVDLTHCGAGASPFGYGDAFINDHVIRAIESGSHGTITNMFELPYAKRALRNTHFSQMRYALTGADAMAMAVDIARASTGQAGLASMTGYHGWILGKPDYFKATTLAWNAPDLHAIKQVHKNAGLAAVIVEPARWYPVGESGDAQRAKFGAQLLKVQQWCRENMVLLIFDEIATGFREDVFSLPNELVKPDIAVFGKGISNGFPFSAVMGTTDAMTPRFMSEGVFCSSTYWAGSVGIAAATGVLDYAEHNFTPYKNMAMAAERYVKLLFAAADTIGTNIEVTRLAKPMIAWRFARDDTDLMPIWTRAMLARNFLAGSRFYAMAAHLDDDVFMDDAIVLDAFLWAFRAANKGAQ